MAVKYKCDTCKYFIESQSKKMFISYYCNCFECSVDPKRKCEYYIKRDIQAYYNRMAEMSKYDN